ncbi:MAG: plastocyanin/azurin family copper-binding protein [Balneolaceae bacterium]|nr:plastocyanin/azurin family copper-binding protein [Balneolaceae bacterium]
MGSVSLLVITGLFLSFLFFSCSSSTSSGIDDSGDNGNGNGTAEPGPNEVWMVNRDFTPSNKEIERGTTITWKNESNEVHTVTSGSNRTHDGLFDSGNISPGGTFSYTFSENGTFNYFCVPHPGMNATIVVVDPQ